VSARIHFVPRDLWVGVYIGPAEFGIGPEGQYRERSIYVCIVPMFPIVIIRRETR
jgi:hypothetical protein